MNRFIQTQDIITQIGTTSRRQDIQAAVLAHFNANLRRLQRQLASWDQNQALNIILKIFN